MNTNTNTNIQNIKGQQYHKITESDNLKITDFPIKYVSSILNSYTQYNNQANQSMPLQGQQAYQYNKKKNQQMKRKTQGNQNIQQNGQGGQNFLTQSLINVKLDNTDSYGINKNKDKDKLSKQHNDNNNNNNKDNNNRDNQSINNNLSTIPQHFTVSKIQKLDSIQEQQYQSVRSQDNFQIKQIFYQPIQIQLPIPLKQQIKNYQLQDVLIPCTFVEINNNNKQQNKKNNLQVFQSKIQNKIDVQKKGGENLGSKSQVKDMSSSKLQANQKNKIITDVLLDKISQLQTKIKTLEQQKKVAQQLNKAASEYQSTPHSQPAAAATFGSIKKNDFTKKFSTVTQTQQTNGSQFRLRQIGARSVTNVDYKIHSNIYNIMLVENKQQNNSVKQQIELLKKKLFALENAHAFGDKSIKNNIRQNNFKFFQNKPQQKLCSPNRRQLGGKIVKRTGSKISQSPQNTYRTNTEQSLQMDAEKGFIRSGPQQFFSGQQSNVNQMTKYSNVHQHDADQRRKKGDSSAIFRKNLGPAIIHKKQINSAQFSKSKTLQFHPSNQKYIVLDSRQTESVIKNESISPILEQYSSQIYLPSLNPHPTPNSTSDELIQIGKLTFRKFGCQINENVVLNVKKFKNCVLFSIGHEQNILWHYQGRFYYGGWKTYSNGEGEKYGKGIQYVPGKYKYKGSFQQGKRSGHGMLIGENGSIYIGNWFDGLKHGKGKLIESDGSQYQGDWKSGKKSGHGKIFYKGTLQFDGNFVGGMKHGFGKQNFQNGDYYQGQYLSNKFQGKGTYIWSSKAVYTGEFRDGKRHGQGVWRSGQANSDTYQGQYQQDNKNGYGVYKWANGATYKGYFKNDLKHGEGSITYENGKVVNMIWDKGNVQKTLQNFKRNQEPQNKSQYSAPKTKLRKSASTRANINLQSAKSLKSQRSLPKGLSVKKQSNHHSNHSNHSNLVQSSPKVQFRTKVNHTDIIKFKMGSDNSSGLISRQGNPIKDPPYKSMQTSSNINMNI